MEEMVNVFLFGKKYSVPSNLTIMGAKPDDQVSVYSVNGQTVGHFRATEEGTLNLSGLRRGVYIMKINNKTIKISK